MASLLPQTIEIFCSCMPEDELYLKKLVEHLKATLKRYYTISIWQSSMIPPGADIETVRRKNLDAAQIILFLISAPFMNDPLRERELHLAIGQLREQKIAVIPVLTHTFNLHGIFPEDLQIFPRDAISIARMKDPDKDQAYAEIAEEILRKLWEHFPGNASKLPQSTTISAGKRLARIEELYFMVHTVNPKLALFRAREQRHKQAWEKLQRPVIAAAIIAWSLTLVDVLAWALGTPILWQTVLKVLLICSATAATISLLFLLQERSKDHDRWLYYQHHRNDLREEKRLYEAEQDIYALVSDPLSVFKQRVLQITRNVGKDTKSSDWTPDYVSGALPD